jgi:hypothetical protein
MTTPYTGYAPGSATLFPVLKRAGSNPDLVDAVNALFYDDPSRWPQVGGSRVPLSTWLVDCPDACAVANWLASRDRDDAFLPGITDDLPTWVSVTTDDAAGTVPYVNPATSSDPDAIYALNYLLDNSTQF